MQTFLPYPSITESASVLDYRRLGKQRVEAAQIYKILTTPNYIGGWKNHPAVLMWKGHESSLAHYYNSILKEWTNRGYKNSMCPMAGAILIYPPWLGDKRLHSSHRSNLLRKDPIYYGQFGWTEPDNLSYFWPTKCEDYKEFYNG